ncbi:hypothetical protein GCM10010873_15190 [Cypionkella aquatica]|uniref:Uncharacterized protein n=1 Tax=Cypionkella aquatica TaxID=1756042 RepID=A0AA37U334_9RHOB|nr:hypothetical protein [Cypionkella aquatica]GLS86545.1 hypothetical protein GCM10010873_15190 [Cypionkella aquatica]
MLKTFALAVVASSFALAALAGPIVDKATEIESLMAAQDNTGAMDAADALMTTVWEANTAIGIREAVLVTEPAAGIGIYNPRADEKYKVGTPILIYAEPFGYGYGSGGDGLYTIGFAVDLKVMTEAGEVLGEIPSVADMALTSRHKLREFQANLTYTLDGIAPGRYVLETTLRDKNSEKSGSFQNTIEIIE